MKAFRLFTLHHAAPETLPKDIRAALGPVTEKNLYCADLPEEIAIAIELWSRFRSALGPMQRAERQLGQDGAREVPRRLGVQSLAIFRSW